MADQKLIDEVGKYIDKYYEPIKDDIKMDKEMKSIFDKITKFRKKRAEEKALQEEPVKESSLSEDALPEEFDVSTMQKTKIQKGMSSTMSVNRNIDNLMNQLEETFSQRLLRMIDERGILFIPSVLHLQIVVLSEAVSASVSPGLKDWIR